MPSIIVRKTQGCPLCEFVELSEFNEKIYGRSYPDEGIVIEIENATGKDIKLGEINAHRKHLTMLTSFDLSGLAEEKELQDENSSNIEVVRARLNRVRSILLQMEKDESLVMSKEYTGILGQFTRLMELKAKMEGNIIDKREITVADVISKLREPEVLL